MKNAAVLDEREIINISPQPGPQEMFLSSPADIVIYGGAAGGGKTFGLLLEPLRHINNPKFSAVIFRRTSNQIDTAGGLLDESKNLYASANATLKVAPNYQWRFPSGAKVQFRHLQYENDLMSWQGSQIPLICFDEVTHFTKKQFIYMLSRNRSTCGVNPYIRCTCNPDPDSFVAEMIEWWIDQETGFAIPERSGVIRYFIVIDDAFVWASTREELTELYPSNQPISFTFIASSIYDNKILLEKDPKYIANLDALGRVDRERLKFGNWKIRPQSGLIFKREWFKVIDASELPPLSLRRTARAWDLAATEKTENNDPDATASVKMSEFDGMYYIEHVSHDCMSPAKVRDSIKNLAGLDGFKCTIRLPQDPGQAGKAQADDFCKLLTGFTFSIKPVSGDKITRAAGISAQVEHGKVCLVRAPWNEKFLSELENFPDGAHDDMVDALSDAFDELARDGVFMDYGALL
ncbi:MAG: phage terminase large subunit [Deferribacterales bacterium]